MAAGRLFGNTQKPFGASQYRQYLIKSWLSMSVDSTGRKDTRKKSEMVL